MTHTPEVDADNGAYREREIEPARTALLSIDMQNAECGADLRAAPPPSKADYFKRLDDVVIPNQRRLMTAARQAGIEVVFTTIESLTLDGRDRSLDHKISRLHCPRGSWEAQVIDELAPLENEIRIPKTASGIFNCTNIEYVLRNLGIEYLIVVGVVTDQCVESAVRDAADRGFLVTQVEDCCATYDADNHARSIAAMRGHYCRTRTTAEMIAEIERLGGAT
ncbi:MAG: isochorismatase family cysteine hydrolase [Alphaproteobacteria bacterium]